MKSNALVFAAVLLLLIAVVPAPAQVVRSTTPLFDALVSSNPAQNATSTATISNSNYGGAGALGVAAAGLSKGEFDSFIRFNLAAVKSSFDTQFGAGLWTIQAITLTLTATPPNNATFFNPSSTSAASFAATWIQSDSFVEGTGNPNNPDTNATHVNYNNRTTYLSPGVDESLGTLSFPGGTTGVIDYPLALTTAFVADVRNGGDVSLYLTPADANIAYLFNSRTGSGQPSLNVTAVPEPSAALFSIGLAMLGAISRCRRETRGGGHLRVVTN